MQRNIFTAAEHPQGSSHSIVLVHMARGAASPNSEACMVRLRSRIAKVTATVGDPKRREGSIIVCIARPERQVYYRSC
jgi:hypothetical protein